MQIGNEQHFRWLRGVVATILVLNLLDALLTLTWLSLDIAVESNALMNTLVSWGPVPFVMGKIALVSGGSFLLWRFRSHPWAVVGLFMVFLVYYALLLYHLESLTLILSVVLK